MFQGGDTLTLVLACGAVVGLIALALFFYQQHKAQRIRAEVMREQARL